MSKRSNPRKRAGKPVERDRLSDAQADLLYDALSAFYSSPHLRSRSFWASQDSEGRWQFSLLGMLCALNGIDLVHIPRHVHNEVCREWLDSAGFTPGHVLAIQEINDTTHDIEVLHLRLERYRESGERMPPILQDDMTEIDRMKEER